MANLRETALRRILGFTFLLHQNPTPLLQEQLSHAIVLHTRALDNTEFSNKSICDDLDTAYKLVEEHWTRLHANMGILTTLLWDINLLEQFLRSKLLEDYANEPYEVRGRMLSLAECTARPTQQRLSPHTEEDDYSDKYYQEHIIFPLEESKLERAHVEDKLRAVAARHGRPGNDIQPLIEAREWKALAVVLTNDRKLTITLIQRSALSRQGSDRILAGINQIQNAHFESISSASEFTLRNKSQSSTIRGFIFGICDAVTSHFTESSPGPGVGNSSDRRPLLEDVLTQTQNLPLSTSKVNLKKLE